MLPPLVFEPVYRRYLWGGRRFATLLDRPLPAEGVFAESWELVDHGADQSVVAVGPLAGSTLGTLVRERAGELLGRHAPQPSFPLLFKFLDACRDLSVQVHPDDTRAARLPVPDRGKTEAWYVVAADPGARIYAGLADGVDAAAFAAAVRAGRCAEVLHAFAVRAGDCIFIPAGTVHAIGAGVLVAEIQQASDVTYRLFDWDRVDADGRPRALHVDAGLEAVTRFGPVGPVATAADAAGVRRLVTSEFFTFDEVSPPAEAWACGGDDRCHFVAVLDGAWALDPGWGLPPLHRGDCTLVPAAAGSQPFAVSPAAGAAARALHVALP